MSVRQILRLGDPRLRQRAKAVGDPFDSSLAELIADLEDTMAAHQGAGLAAPQIGVALRVVLFGGGGVNPRYPDAAPVPHTLLINPVLTPLADEQQEGWEGCLSVPGLRGRVRRWQQLRYQGLDAAGNKIERCVEGFHARVVQHECDHLDGVLFPDKLSDPAAFGFIPELEAAGLIPSVPG
ncbi:MAG: peptide deformylase [Synechococcus lacustris]|jgi:peptide deformylase